MIVRPAREADIPALAAVAASSYASGFAGILSPEELAVRNAAFVRAALRRVAAAGDRGGDRRRDRRIFEGDRRPSRHAVHRSRRATAPAWGRPCLREAEARGTCTLECFRDNRSARSFYERHGWTLARSYEREFLGRTRAFVFYEKRAPGLRGGEGEEAR